MSTLSSVRDFARPASLSLTFGRAVALDDFARVRVGRPEPRQYPRLERLHALGLLVRLMIVADDMEKSMGDGMAVMVGERHTELVSLARQRLEGERDVAEL